MEIKIDDKTLVRVHDSSYAICKKVNKKGEQAWEEEAWHTSLVSLMTKLAQKKLSEDSRRVEMHEFIEIYKEVHEEIKTILQPIQ